MDLTRLLAASPDYPFFEFSGRLVSESKSSDVSANRALLVEVAPRKLRSGTTVISVRPSFFARREPSLFAASIGRARVAGFSSLRLFLLCASLRQRIHRRDL